MSEDSAGEQLCCLKFFLLIGIYFDHRFSQVFFPSGLRYPLNTTISNARICFRSFFWGWFASLYIKVLRLISGFTYYFLRTQLLTIYFHIFSSIFLHYSANPCAGPLGPFNLLSSPCYLYLSCSLPQVCNGTAKTTKRTLDLDYSCQLLCAKHFAQQSCLWHIQVNLAADWDLSNSAYTSWHRQWFWSIFLHRSTAPMF